MSLQHILTYLPSYCKNNICGVWVVYPETVTHVLFCPEIWLPPCFDGHCKYLGFAWSTSRSHCFFEFTVFPFGLSTACYVFTTLLRPLVRYWCGKGQRVLVYLDNGCQWSKAGFVTHPTKSVWVPTTRLQGLGLSLTWLRVRSRCRTEK